MSGPLDDGSSRSRGVVRPPPGPESADSPSSIEVPRLDPPPPSLEAMVQSAATRAESSERSTWPLLLAVVVLAAAITAYVSR